MRLLIVPATIISLLVLGVGSAAAAKPSSGQPDFGPNVLIFDPSMSTSQIQAAVDAVAAQQVPNQFGTQRYALLFKPGTYGTAQNPLNFQVGYYTSVAGLGREPGDVTVNGSIYVRNQCTATGCVALNNFWRSLSNLTIDVNTPNFGCYTGEFWAVSQAAPMRRVHVNGFATLMDYCTGPSFASGGFIADSRFDGGDDRQRLAAAVDRRGTARSTAGRTASGTRSSRASSTRRRSASPAVPNGCGPYTTIPTSPVTRDAPYLYVDSAGNYNVFVPAVQHNSAGADWEGGSTPGSSIPIDDFFIAKPSDDAQAINNALARGQNLIFTPGVYHLDRTLKVKRADTVVLGLGFPTLVPDNGAGDDGGRRRPGREARRPALRRRPGELAGAAAGRQAARAQERPRRSDLSAGRLLPHRRRDAGQGDHQPRREQRQRAPGRHLGLARRPRQRRRLDGEHRRHRRGRQRRRRHRVRPVRRALPEATR